MKDGRTGIRYRWMRRATQVIALAAGSVALFGSLSAGTASAAVTQSANGQVASAAARPMAPPPFGWCNRSHDGWVWIDLDTGKRWQCIQNILGEWVLVELSSVPPGTCPGAIADSKAAVKPDVVVCG
jgi:hypothetical protein